jgi:very-short-patch-repair endonuclease
MRPPIIRARAMRKTMSEPEVMLWAKIKLLRERGFHFRRQAPFRGYFLDFVCFSRRLAVEVDGFQHGDEVRGVRDAVRDRILERHGFTVLRFWTHDVRQNLGGVMDQIIEVLQRAPPAHGRQSEDAEPEPHSPTQAAARPVPPP